MLEDVGVFGAIERGHALTGSVFWRVFGIALLTAIITSIAGSMLGVPVTMVMDALLSGGLDSQYAALSLTLVNAVSVGGAGGLRGPVHGRGHLPAVRRPAHPQGGVRRGADDPSGDHRPVMLPVMLLEPPLDPSGDEARSLLRRELLHPEYHQDNLVLRLVNWLSRLLDRGLDRGPRAAAR